MMKLTVTLCLLIGFVVCDDYVNTPTQYHSANNRGAYNFGYDTGVSGSHQFHQESRGDDGVVRGRYGYTDPDGKLRLTYYTSDALNGYKVWGTDIPENNGSPAPLKVKETSKVSSRIIYPQSPASKVSSLKSAKIVLEPQPPAKTVHSEQIVTTQKVHYSPAETFRSRYTSSDVVSKTAPVKKVEVKGAQIVETVQTQQQEHIHQSPVAAIKSLPIKGTNRPIPITPAQYRANYPPAGRYSRCYCE